jgi:glycosyltransferase involved in cell wall biosynthesis
MEDIHVHRYRYAPERWELLAYDGGMLRRVKKSPLIGLLLPTFLFSQWRAVRRLQRMYDFSLIHAHWIVPQGLVAAFVPGKFLLTSHGGDLYGLRSGVLSSAKRWILKKASHITVVSRAMVDECVKLGVLRDKVTVCSMGVDTRSRFVPPNAGVSRNGILFVGRLVEKKGVVHLIHAIRLLKDRGIEASLTLIGDGPDARKLRDLVIELDLVVEVKFLGAVSNSGLPAYYQAAEIFVLPSVVSADGDQEGLGLVSIEAMACGCPVVASDLPSVRDVISNKIDGLLVPPAEPQMLSDALALLLENADLRLEFARAGLKKAADFDWKTVCARYSRIIEQSISNAARRVDQE